jgi:hypothetical protein
MSLPTRNDAKPVDVLLTDYAMGYAQNKSGGHVASQIGAVKKVKKSSDRYAIWDKGDFWRSEMQQVGRGESSPEAGFRLSTDTYFCDDYKLKKMVLDEDVTDSDVDLRLATTEYLVDQALLKRDKVVAAAIFATGLWTGITEETGVSASPSTNEFLQWNDSSSVPIKDFIDARESVRQNCGYLATHCVTSWPVINALSIHSDIVARYQYTTGGGVSLEQLEQLLGVKFIVGGVMENTAKEAATDSLSDVWGKNALFLYVDPNPSPNSMTPSAVTTFSWSDYDKMDATGAAIKSWRSDDPDGEWLRVQAAFDCKITAQDAGVFHLTCVA